MFIPGHVGIDGNEKINRQVKSAIVTSPLNLTRAKYIKTLLDSIELES